MRKKNKVVFPTQTGIFNDLACEKLEYQILQVGAIVLLINSTARIAICGKMAAGLNK